MSADLVSLVISLQNPQPVSMPYDQGRALSAQFLAWVQKIDPALSQSLHDPQNTPRAYTVSNFLGLPLPTGGRVLLPAQSKTEFRITSLSPELSHLVTTELISQLPGVIKIGRQLFEVVSVACKTEEHQWAGSQNYNQLIEQALLGSPDHKIMFQFASATAFNRHGVCLSFPLPRLAIASWLMAWNKYSPVQYQETLLNTIEDAVVVSYYKMQTIPVRYGKATIIGGVGECTYTILEKDPYWVHVVNVLSSYAFYCGTGAKTALGMGQTRRL